MFNSISKKVMMGYIGIVFVLILTAVFLFRESSLIYGQKETFVTETLPTLRSVESVASGLSGVQIAAFGLYGLTIELPAFQREISEAKTSLKNDFAVLVQAGIVQRGKLDTESAKIWRSVEQLRSIMAQESTDWDGAREALMDIQNQMVGLQKIINEVKVNAARNAEQSSDMISSQIAAMRTLIVGSVILILVITLGSFMLARHQIARPIKSLSKQLDKIVANRDLSNDVMLNCNDELADAGKSVNELLAATRATNTEIQVSSGVLVESVEQLNHSAKVSEEQVALFNTHIGELLNNIGLLESSIGQSAQRSGEASETALRGAEQVRLGADSVSDTSNSILALAEDIEKSAEMLLSLKNAGDQVSSVVKTIAEIAEQTNLLALNAAIEAARAGESGRGFAVVADEVRTLASRTHDSTHEINAILDTIVASITSTVTSMDSNKVKATRSVELAQSTVTSLDEIQDTVIRLSDENGALANLAQDIKSNANAMRSSIDAIESASEHVTESSEETRTASASLSETSGSLNQIARQFKV